MKCPVCGRDQHYFCGNEKCVCAELPKNERQVVIGLDVLACPWCGHQMLFDEWESEAMRQYEMISAVHSSACTCLRCRKSATGLTC